MIVNVGPFQFVLTRCDNDRRVIVVKDTTSNAEVCIDASKEQVSTLGDALKALSTDAPKTA